MHAARNWICVVVRCVFFLRDLPLPKVRPLQLLVNTSISSNYGYSEPNHNKRSKLIPESDVPHAVQRINLQLILQYVGPNDWFYMGGVSSLWQQVYKRICGEHAKQQKLWVLKHGKRCSVGPVEATCTYYTKAFASVSRLQLACAVGVELGIVRCLPQQAGMCADKQTLLYARAQGLPWGKKLTQSLADEGRLELLQWAHLEKQCPWCDTSIVKSALQRVDLPMLQWLHSTMPHASLKEQVQSCSAVAIGLRFAGSIRALAWLHSAKLLDLNDDLQRQSVSDAAIAGGHVHTLQWLRSREEHDLDTEKLKWEGEIV
jgi:hypothetical protein